jgi:Xaa-Pro aminopeptidase
MVLEDGAGVDFTALRVARRDGVFRMMEEHGIDVLMLGRQANTRYVVGHRPIWRMVVTAWAPMCTLVLATRQVHLLATTWADGIPSDIPTDNLSGLTWNPRNVVAGVSGIGGLADAKVIAVDGMSPSMPMLLGMLAPDATIVDGERLLRDVRAVKLSAEIECIQTALAITEGALAAVRAELRPGVTEVSLKCRFHEAMAGYGVNHPTYEGVFCATPRARGEGAADGPPPLRTLSDGRALEVGDLVAVSAAAPFAGYEGVVARTWSSLEPTGHISARTRALGERGRAALAGTIGACVPGASPVDVRRAWEQSGEPLPPVPLAMGVGIGIEYPVIGAEPAEPRDEQLHAGMVLGVQGYVWEPGVGGSLVGETVHVTDDGPVVLTRLGHE